MKQTSVEWLYETLWKQTDFSLPSNILEQAKGMEKQQIIDAHGNQQKKSGGVSNYTYILTGEKYYEETFTNPLNINPK
jgi:hypothetical protein